MGEIGCLMSTDFEKKKEGFYFISLSGTGDKKNGICVIINVIFQGLHLLIYIYKILRRLEAY